MAWKEERVALLKELHGKGWTVRQIAKKFGDIKPGAVGAKAWRLGLPERSGGAGNCKPRNGCSVPCRPKKYVVQGHSGVVRPAKVTEENRPGYSVERASDAAALAIAQLTSSMCKWPEGDPMADNGFHFCGRHKRFMAPYCDKHMAVAYSVKGKQNV